MAVDPNTGQTVINIPGFDQRYAEFIDPATMAQLAAQQGQLGQQGSLAHAMLAQGQNYIPNSGFAGALAQMVQSALGMKMLQDSQSQMGDVYTKQLQAAQAAAKEAAASKRGDQTFATDEEIRKTKGQKQAEEEIKLANADQEAKNAASAAGLKATAELPAQQALEKTKGGYQVAAAVAGAREHNLAPHTIPNPTGDGTALVIQPQADGTFKTQVAGTAGGPNKIDQQEIAKRVPVLQDQLNKFDTALGVANDMQAKMKAGQYDAGSLRNAAAGHVPLLGPYLQSTGGQELGTDAGNLILAAQSALQGTGGKGSVAQLRILQQSKPNAQMDAAANQNAIDKIVKELESSRQHIAAEMQHYGAGGTPKTWAQVAAAPSAPTAQGKYAVGDVIEHGGKRYKVTGGDPNDPNLEPLP